MPKGFLRWFNIIMLGVYLGVAVIVCFDGAFFSSILAGALVGNHIGGMYRHKRNPYIEIINKQDELITRLMNYFERDFSKITDRLEKLRQTPREGDEWKEGK